MVRETIGPDVKLLVDANNAYNAHEAIEIARKMEKYEPFWFEEPVAPDDYRGHARVARSTSIPIASGENEYSGLSLSNSPLVKIGTADQGRMMPHIDLHRIAAAELSY